MILKSVEEHTQFGTRMLEDGGVEVVGYFSLRSALTIEPNEVANLETLQPMVKANLKRYLTNTIAPFDLHGFRTMESGWLRHFPGAAPEKGNEILKSIFIL